jgi:hypothetical protein
MRSTSVLDARASSMMFVFAVLVAAGCGDSSTTTGDLVADCKTICQRQRDAQCPNDALDSCEIRCDQHGGVPGCEAKFDALVTCAKGSAISCGSTGVAMATACQAQTDALGACVLSGGTPGSSNAQSCAGGMNWTTACRSCLMSNCAAEFANAYGSAWTLERIAADGACGPVWQCYCDCRTNQPTCPTGGISQCPSSPTDLPPGCDEAMTAKNQCATGRCSPVCDGMI